MIIMADLLIHPLHTTYSRPRLQIQFLDNDTAHEVGHTVSLRHDGRTPNEPYLFGLPAWGVLPANRRWNAIMGGVGKSSPPSHPAVVCSLNVHPCLLPE